jgi:predicted RNA-binding protein
VCDLNAYMLVKEGEDLILENVDSLEAEDGKLRLTSIFGEVKVVEGTVKSLSLREHKVILTGNS